MTKNFDNVQLLSIVQRVEKLNEDQAAIATDLKEVMSGRSLRAMPRNTSKRWLNFAKWTLMNWTNRTN